MTKFKFSPKRPLTIALIVLGVFLISVIFYYALQIYQGKGIEFKAQSLQLSRPDTPTEIDPNTGWKIYRNVEYGFEIMYPQEFSAVDWAYKAGNRDLLIYIGKNTDIGDGPVAIGIEREIHSFDEYFQKHNYYPEYRQEFKDVKIGFDNYKAKMFSEKASYNSEEYTGNLDYVNYFIEHADRLFSIYYDRKEQDQISEKEFQQILSTFKLLPEQSLEVDPETEWKTYKDTKYGFEIKYPKSWYVYPVSPAEVYFQPDEEQPGNIPGPHASALSIIVTPVSSGVRLLDAINAQIKEEGNAGIKFTSEEIEIGGLKGLRVKTTCEGVGCGAPEWFVIKGHHLYHFDSNLGYTAVFDQILATVKID